MKKLGSLVISMFSGLVAAQIFSISTVSAVMAFVAGIFMTHSP
jgi:hypothetical protein